ncbi:serine hydrolase domain-containing protein [Winogradskyella flava]|uniref:serine hydrolase domain-containing protein n=1 Tax=Winogradskyella flava TaxID=1884876 RepID=UPI002491E1F8|nr:serine hydrolase domain-containing protein [Winogradskyella flava]
MKNLYVLYILLSSIVFAQNQSIEKQLDSIFTASFNHNQPGVAAGLIKDGEIIYLKGFGSANRQTSALITPQTKFQLGELSKQFTTLAILLLEAQGKISLNEDIRKYIPELPKYKHVITIKHLLNHSSGLHDINRMSYMIDGSMTIDTQAKAIKLIASQKALSFKPGTQFSFHESVTESILMAEIVSKSSGEPFSDLVKSHIFEPLGMKNSLIRDDSNAILTNLAQPYQKEEGKDYKKLEVLSNVVGAINAYCSAEDLAAWYLNYFKPNGIIGKLIQQLDTPVRLDSGEKFNYYWGDMAIGREFTHPERGLPIFWNYGFQGAYGTNVFRYLNQDIVAFVLGNNNQYNGMTAQWLLNPCVEDTYTLPANIDFSTKNIKKLSAKKLKSFEGHYWYKKGYASEIFIKNDTLRSKWLFSPRDRYQTLVPLSDSTFQQYAEMEDTRLFDFKEDGNGMTLFFTYNESQPDIMERYEPVRPSEKDLQAYTGVYYNETYALLFSFRIEDGKLIASNLNHTDITFRPVKKDIFTSRSLFFNALEFFRDASNNIKGFTINTDGINNLEFRKVIEL